MMSSACGVSGFPYNKQGNYKIKYLIENECIVCRGLAIHLFFNQHKSGLGSGQFEGNSVLKSAYLRYSLYIRMMFQTLQKDAGSHMTKSCKLTPGFRWKHSLKHFWTTSTILTWDFVFCFHLFGQVLSMLIKFETQNSKECRHFIVLLNWKKEYSFILHFQKPTC